ncbi:MAG TPA: helix-turn-helix domain-containing protein [Chloroflexota bacterium]|nr:helix-turn-helix domain-containing protein [Chloroflexota bacterium]
MSVRTAWERLLPAGTELLGGQAGLDRPLSWPVVLRTHPPAFDPLRGGELAIVPLDRLHLLDDRLTLARVVAQLARTRVGAVAAIGAVDEEAIRAADAAGVALLRLPDGSSPAEVHGALTRAVAELRVQLSTQVGRIGRELAQLAVEGRGRTAIARRAGQLADAAALLDDGAGESLLVYVPPASARGRAALERLAGALPDGAAADGVRRQPLDDGVVALAAPIAARERAAGRLVLVLEDRAPTGFDAAVLEQAAAACAIDLAREEAALAARDELLGGFLDELLRGDFSSEEAIERRSRQLGYDLTRPHLVLAVGPVDDDPTLGQAESVAGQVRTDPSVGEPVAARAVDDAVVVLAPLADREPDCERGRAGERIAAALSADGRTVSVGVGGVAAGPRALFEAADRALQALRIGRRVRGAGSTTDYAELGPYQLLLELRGSPALARFRRRMLAPLVEHDRRTNGELLRTLDAYLACGCSPTAAAERLHLHRNGLLYRLQRIREILPVDLDDPEQRLGLHLALRIGDVLDPDPEADHPNGVVGPAAASTARASRR